MEVDPSINNYTYDFNLDEVMKYATSRYETVEKRQQKIFNALVECTYNNIILNNIISYQSRKEYAFVVIYRILNQDFISKYHITSVSDFYRISTIDNKLLVSYGSDYHGNNC